MNTGLKDRLETAKAAQETGLSTTSAKDSVLGWLNSPGTATELARALPSGMDAGRFARIVQTEVRKNPDLLKTTPQSFILAVLNAAQLGLEPGPLGHSFLVPLRNNKTNQLECNLWLGYKGLKELAYRGGTVDFIDAVVVHQGEPFRIVRQPDSHLEHEELPACAEAPIVAYYAFAALTGPAGMSGVIPGRVVFEVMWPKDIEGIRKRSRAKDAGPWVTDFEAMALKTVTRRLLNRGKVRLKAEIAEAIQEDEARELGYDKPELLPSLSLEGAGEAGAGQGTKPAKSPASPASNQAAKPEPPTSEGAPAAKATQESPETPAAAASPVPSPARCEICGAVEDESGHLKHDDQKHAEVAKAKKEARKQQATDAGLFEKPEGGA